MGLRRWATTPGPPPAEQRLYLQKATPCEHGRGALQSRTLPAKTQSFLLPEKPARFSQKKENHHGASCANVTPASPPRVGAATRTCSWPQQFRLRTTCSHQRAASDLHHGAPSPPPPPGRQNNAPAQRRGEGLGGWGSPPEDKLCGEQVLFSR